MRSRARNRPPALAAVFVAALLLAATGLARAQQERTQRYELRPESTMRIAGHATTGDFTCAAGDVVGHGRFFATGEAPPEATLAARVRSFDCGKRRMNADFYEALKSAEHPLIRFALSGVEALGTDGEGGERQLRAEGTLRLAGAARRVVVTLAGWRGPDGRLRGRGEKTLRMTDFGVEPPTALLGLVKVRDRLTVHFDLVAAPSDTTTARR